MLVPRHRGFDRLARSKQDGQFLVRDQNLDAARDARLSANESFALEGEDHLVNGRGCDAEVVLDLGFGRRPTMHADVGNR